MSESVQDLSLAEAFEKRHSTRNFSQEKFTEAQQQFVNELVTKINEHHTLFGVEKFEIKQAPNGYGKLGFIVHESGWLFPKLPVETDNNKQRKLYISVGYLLQRCVMEMTQKNIATCWIGGTYNRSKAEEFCGGNCSVPACIAFGGDDKDRWVEHIVKFFGSFRGSNKYQDKFYDLKNAKKITLEEVGERSVICMALNKIPCAMKPHSYRIVFDEPNIHVFNDGFDAGPYKNIGCFDVGIVIANIEMYIVSTGKACRIHYGEHPDCPLGGTYVCTLSVVDSLPEDANTWEDSIVI